MAKKYHSITDIVATVYCEQKAVFDKVRGDARPLSIKAKAVHGNFEHMRFQVEGQTQQAIDRRCFIASHIYGSDAIETNWFRSWRDAELLRRPFGGWVVQFYYATSPYLLVILRKSPWLTGIARTVLNRVAKLLGRPT